MTPSVRSSLTAAAVTALAAGLAACGADPAAAPATSPSLATFPTAGAVILQDTFDNDSNGWGVVDNPEFGTASYEAGNYVWHTTGRVVSLVPETLGQQFDAGTLSMSDVEVKAEVTINKGGGVVGVQCRNSPDNDAGYHWYDFVARDGYAAIRLADDKSNIDVLAETKDVTLPLGKPFTIVGACLSAGDDVKLSLGIDDTPLLAATAPAKAADGAPGIVGWTYPVHSELDVTWDDFTVAKPE
jgi:hypothetical protein